MSPELYFTQWFINSYVEFLYWEIMFVCVEGVDYL